MPDAARAAFRTAPVLVPGEASTPGFDIIYGVSTLHRRFACARLSGSYLPRSCPGFSATLPSRPGEFHPEPLTDPDVTLSRRPARATERRLPPPVEDWSSSCCQLTHSQRRWPAPFAPRALPRFLATTEQSAPARRIGTFGLAVSLLVPFPLASPARFSSSVRKPRRESRLLYTGHRVART